MPVCIAPAQGFLKQFFRGLAKGAVIEGAKGAFNSGAKGKGPIPDPKPPFPYDLKKELKPKVWSDSSRIRVETIIESHSKRQTTIERREKALSKTQSIKYVDKEEMLNTLLKYIAVESGSEETTDGSYPMTPGQIQMAKLLKADAEALGAKVTMTEWGYVYVDVPSNVKKEVPVLGISCHLDYTPEAPGKGIKPTVITDYKGGDIILADGSVISPSNPDGADLPGLIGKTIIHSDGTTLLGADDKNGCTIVMSLLKTVLGSKMKHGRIQMAFCPNEDIGMAAEKIDTTYFNPDILFDVDGKGGNEIAASNFSAKGMKIRFIGHEAHASVAKEQKLGDALAAAATFIAAVPVQHRPENTEGREGYIHPWNLTQEGFDYTVTTRIRYFDKEEGKRFEEIIDKALEQIKRDFPNVGIEILSEGLQYENVAYSMHPESRGVLERAAAKSKIEIKFVPERGGTTAAMFSAKGLRGGMNIFSGQHNCHKVHEYACLEEMMDAYILLVSAINEIVQL